MDTNIKEIVDYLEYIGILPKSAISNFHNLYNSFLTRYSNCVSSENSNSKNRLIKSNSSSLIYSSNSNNEEFIIQTLSTYIMSLTITQIKNMSSNIIKKFFKNKTKINGRFMNNIFKIYSNKKLKTCFQFWKKNSFDNNDEINNNIINEINEMKTNLKNPISNFNILKNIQNHKSKKLKSQKKNISKSFISDSNNNNPSKTKRKNNFISTYNSLNNSINCSQNFIKRQNEYTKKVQENKEKAKNKSEEELQLLCSFSPKLYENSLKVKSRYYNNIINTPKSSSKKKEKTKTLSRGKSYSNLSSEVTERLYNDFTKYKQKRIDLQKSIDNERGITFKPKSYTQNSGYLVEGNFGERNRKLLEDRQNFAFVYDYLRQKKINENSIGGGYPNQLIYNYLQGNNDIKNNLGYNELLPDSNE